MQDANPQSTSDFSLMEEELQTELRSMFELDTQTYLQTYEQVTQQLNSETWMADIQELYRSIHTIKGGAVTVGADAVLATTTALEEMLSDLRYLQASPNLEDGALIAILVEAGEVVSGSLLISAEESDGGPSVLTSALDRLKTLHGQVQDQFLNEIDEHQQLCQDFANQGFDLMVLDVEMALEQLPDAAQIPATLVDTAAQVFTALETVGNDLEMGSSWSLLMRPLFELLLEDNSDIWRSRCQCYLTLLKDCALEGGTLTEAAIAQLQLDGISIQSVEPTSQSSEAVIDSDAFMDWVDEDAFSDTVQETHPLDQKAVREDIELPLIEPQFDQCSHNSTTEETVDLGWITEETDNEVELTIADQSEDNLQGTADFDSFLDDIAQPLAVEDAAVDQHVDADIFAKEEQLLSQALKQIETAPQLPEPVGSEVNEFSVPEDFLESLETTTQNAEAEPEWLIDTRDEPTNLSEGTDAVQNESNQQNRQSTTPKIPVPLDRLDRSAQTLVEILLSARSTQGRYQSLQDQVARIVQLSQESAAYITQLRQMQDDYALLQNLSHQASHEAGIQLEGYRSGYTAINRLLENSLRLSEIGAEAAATAQVTKQEFNRLNTHIKALQNNVEESRLISFKSVAFRLRAVVRDLINRLGKPVDFVIEGESQNLDAGTIQVLEPALLHLVRNAYDHGIEESEARLQNSKPEVATITLSLKRQGSFYYLSLMDDGGGIDRRKISAIAASKDLPLTQTETNAQLLQVICQPGFSSQVEVSAVSGRGVGMDVVNHQVQSIGGTLKLTTELKQGTQFDIKIPVPHLLVPCTVVKAGAQQFAIPTDAIQTMRLWDETCIRVERPPHDMLPWGKEFEGKLEPMMPVMNYWQASPLSPEINPDKMETAICCRVPCHSGNSGSDAIWLVIDDWVEDLDLLITALPSPLTMPIGMMGMSTLPTGDIIPVLEAGAIAQTLLGSNPEAFIQPALSKAANNSTPKNPQENTNPNLILVVDDAALLRRRLEMSLVNYGYEVQCCRDGLEAWNWLQDNPAPGLMITDIEMPQMDGLTLVDRCRQSGRTFPILVSSSRLSEEWSKEAKRVGADDYLTKGFSTNELIDCVSGLISTPIPS